MPFEITPSGRIGFSGAFHDLIVYLNLINWVDIQYLF